MQGTLISTYTPYHQVVGGADESGILFVQMSRLRDFVLRASSLLSMPGPARTELLKGCHRDHVSSVKSLMSQCSQAWKSACPRINYCAKTELSTYLRRTVRCKRDAESDPRHSSTQAFSATSAYLQNKVPLHETSRHLTIPPRRRQPSKISSLFTSSLRSCNLVSACSRGSIVEWCKRSIVDGSGHLRQSARPIVGDR